MLWVPSAHSCKKRNERRGVLLLRSQYCFFKERPFSNCLFHCCLNLCRAVRFYETVSLLLNVSAGQNRSDLGSDCCSN